MREFTFNLKLACEITVKSDDGESAEELLASIVVDMDRIVNAKLAKRGSPFVSADLYKTMKPCRFYSQSTAKTWIARCRSLHLSAVE